MKKLLYTFALLLQVGWVTAGNKSPLIVYVRQDNVKLFQQPGTSTPILENIRTTDRIEFIRKWNTHWALVLVNGKAGYVIYSELTQLKEKSKDTKVSQQ